MAELRRLGQAYYDNKKKVDKELQTELAGQLYNKTSTDADSIIDSVDDASIETERKNYYKWLQTARKPGKEEQPSEECIMAMWIEFDFSAGC
ncbi:hypothetical protein FACS1894152_4340 [Bacilli bacterium]|nr:hypothetical protein FACS1894152_4340 [Bacilli bacterium]